MNEKEFFMPGIEKDEAIKKWKEFHKQVNKKNEFTIPVYEFSYDDEEGRHRSMKIDGYFKETSKKIIAIVQSESGMAIYTEDHSNNPNCIIKEYNKGAEELFMERSDDNT